MSGFILRLTQFVLLLGFAGVQLGCTSEAKFRLNAVQQHQMELQAARLLAKQTESEQDEPIDAFIDEASFSDAQVQNIADILVGLFGTPDEPNFPAVRGEEVKVVDVDRLRLAAGPVGKDESGLQHGLYRQHCAHCHGITGDGLGPTAAFLNPYPRDYRFGIFKFTSTPKGEKPTDEDLMRILKEGIPGTAMPSFFVLDSAELTALVDYVKYLSIRGEVERLLFDRLRTGEPGQLLWNLAAPAGSQYAEGKEIVNEVLSDVVQKWVRAPEVVTVPKVDRPWDSHKDVEVVEQQIKRGRELFLNQGNCYECHGDVGIGDGELTRVGDFVAKTFVGADGTEFKTLDAIDPKLIRTYLAHGALAPRIDQPRNLRHGVYRGGRRPIDLYWRIRNGVDGTIMPGVSLPDEDIWAIIEYVQFMPYETISQPRQQKPVNEKERQS